MASTALLTDIALEDETTGPTAATDSDTYIDYLAPCDAALSVEVTQTVVWDGGSPQVIDSISATSRINAFHSGIGVPCPSPAPPVGIPASVSFEVSRSDDGVSWTLVQAGTPTTGVYETVTSPAGFTARYIKRVLTGTFDYPRITGTLQASAQHTDFRVGVAEPETNELPQCATRTFDADGADDTASHLWEIYQDGILLDFGDRYDRFGANGWGVIYPGLSGAGTISVTAPDATIGTGYQARAEGNSALFEIVAGSCSGSSPGTPMNNVIHSTGLIYVSPRLEQPTLTRVDLGAPPAASNPLANGGDGNPSTAVDLTYTNAGNRQYLRADFGSSQEIQSVILSNVTGSASVAVYASNSAITDGDFSGATAIALSAGDNPATAEGLRFENAAFVSARYIYIVALSSLSIGEIDIRGEKVPIGCVQNLRWGTGYEEALLRCVPYLNQYPIADAQYDFTFTIEAEYAEFDPRAAELLTGAVLNTAVSPDTITPTLLTKPLRFTIEFTGQTVEGKEIQVIAYDAVAPGMNWQFNRDAFALLNFVARVYLSDVGAIPFIIRIEE